VCTNFWSKGGADTRFQECVLGAGKFTAVTDKDTNGGFTTGSECAPAAETLPAPVAPPAPPSGGSAGVVFGPTVFKNLAGQVLATLPNSDLGKCMDACRAASDCSGFNLCRGAGPGTGCGAGGASPVNACDLKRFDGAPVYWDDSTAVAGDGYMSQVVASRGSATISPGPVLSKNLAGTTLDNGRSQNSNADLCQQLCTANPKCKGWNFCEGPKPLEGCGGASRLQCDLKTWDGGDAAYWDGEGYKSQVVR
jgi:hypothetical protein